MTYIILVILLILFGVLLLLAEIFLLPGFGIAGVSGFVSLIASVVLAYIKLTPVYPYAGHIALGAVIIVSAIAVYAFIKSHAIEKMALDTTIDSSVSMPEPGARMEEMAEDGQKSKDKR